MNLQEILNVCNSLLNKELSGAISPDQYNDILKITNLEYINYLLGLPQTFPAQRVAYDINSVNSTALAPFKKVLGGRDYPLLSIDQQGVADLPTDFYLLGSITYKQVIEDRIIPRQVEVLKDNQQGRRGSSLIPPSKKYPICYFYDNYIKFFPEDLRYCEMEYIKKPVTPVYAYTIDANDNVIYDATNSVQFEYPESSHIDLVRIILGHMGVNLKSTFITQYAEIQKQKGV